MVHSPLGAGRLFADVNSLNNLKSVSSQQNPQAVREAAKQFESLFMQELLKSMRQATLKSGLGDNEGTQLGEQLFDQQLSVAMSGQPGGLADLLVKQLQRQFSTDMAVDRGRTPPPSNAAFLPPRTIGNTESVAPTASVARSGTGNAISQFVHQHLGAAQSVAENHGIPVSYLLGQAGHESGWGKAEIRHANGQPSHNLFGIKANANWTGPVAEVMTTEFIDGAPRKMVARFRAYPSYEAAFEDYAKLVGGAPRYAQTMQSLHSAHAFAHSLQRAGYATDPQYANKLVRAIESVARVQPSLDT
jgi:flagellar protein FlgJ